MFFAVITGAIPAFSLAGGLIDMGYDSRGGSMSSWAARSKEPIQPIPVNYDYDRPKIALGKKLFFEPRLSKSGWISCNSCHNGFGVGGASFQRFGNAKPYTKDTQTLGRYHVTKNEKDKYVFKVPLLRNIELTAPYFHDASAWRLSEAVRVMAEYQLGTTFTDDETNKIVAFLRTLTGEQPAIISPILPPQAIILPTQTGIGFVPLFRNPTLPSEQISRAGIGGGWTTESLSAIYLHK